MHIIIEWIILRDKNDLDFPMDGFVFLHRCVIMIIFF